MNKVAFVTGSSRGIGFGILKQFAENGYHVVMSGASGEERAKDNLEALRSLGVKVFYVRCNIADDTERRNALSAIIKEFGRLDVLVNNAGVAPLERKNILEVGEDGFDHVVNTNLRGTFFMCQLFANQMIMWLRNDLRDYAPRIVNVSSISAYTSSVNRGEYCVSKAGIAMVTALFADCLAGHGIPVFEVRPGIIATDMTSGVKEKYDAFIQKDGGLPVPRWGTPEDVGKAVFALCGGAFDYSPGQVINVDGGFHIRRL